METMLNATLRLMNDNKIGYDINESDIEIQSISQQSKKYDSRLIFTRILFIVSWRPARVSSTHFRPS